MTRSMLLPVLTIAAACSSVQPLPRVPQVPLLDLSAPSAVARPEPVLRAAADHSPPSPMPADTVAEDRSASYQPISYRTVTRIVEVPAEPSPQPVRETFYPVEHYQPVYYEPSYRYRRYHYGDEWFPINTAIGAGIGAIIGNQHGRRDRGALIGGAYGLLFDLHHWWR